MNEKIDIFIGHYRNSFLEEFLEYSLRITAKNNKIYLLGNNVVAHFNELPNVEFINVDKYINHPKIIELKSFFVNYSAYDYEWDWSCYCKIFMMYLFMKEHNKKQLFHLDSDCVLLKNVNTYPFEKPIAYHILSNSLGQKKYSMANSLHNSLLNEEFCIAFEKIYKELYITKEKFYLIKDKIEHHKQKDGSYRNGGICDMTLCYLLNKYNYIEVDDLGSFKDLDGDKVTFVNRLNGGEGPDSTDQYLLENNILKMTKDENGNKNLIYDKINKQYVDLFGIHFQGKNIKYLNKDWINTHRLCST